jgi:hypothetical protein
MVIKSDKSGAREGESIACIGRAMQLSVEKRSRTTGMILDWVILRVLTIIHIEDL